MSRPTVNDVARVAGVSLATVDRVLDARPGMRPLTITRVNEAIEALGCVRDVSAANLARQRRYELAFILPESEGQFARALARTVERAARRAPPPVSSTSASRRGCTSPSPVTTSSR